MAAKKAASAGIAKPNRKGVAVGDPFMLKKGWNFMENKGFSLVELIVVIAIMAILVGVAVPVYTSYIDKAEKAVDEQYLSEVVYAAQLFAAENGLVLEKIAIAPVVKADTKQGIELFAKDGDTVYRVEDLSALYDMVGSYNPDVNYDHYYTPNTNTTESAGTCPEHAWVFDPPATCIRDGVKRCTNDGCGATQIDSATGHAKGSFLFKVGNLEIYGCSHEGCDYQIVVPQGHLIG